MKPFQSKLLPHFDLIRDLRRHRKTWKEISIELSNRGTTTAPNSIYEFMKRHIKRPVPYGFDEPAAVVKKCTPKKSVNAIRKLAEISRKDTTAKPPVVFVYDQDDDELLK